MRWLPVVAVMLLAGLLSSPALTQAQQTPIPGIPSLFYGSVSIDGQPVADGSAVRAFVGGVDCTPADAPGTATVGGVSTYVVGVLSAADREGCGTEGATVSFTIDGQDVPQTGSWAPEPQELNINAGSGSPLPLPTFTPVPEGNATASPTVGEGDGQPTEEGVTSSATVSPDEAEAEDDDDGLNVALLLGVGALALTVGGAALWYVLRKRA